jgi:antitoxin component YwqK of YwqJK toxin-antitoxin module
MSRLYPLLLCLAAIFIAACSNSPAGEKFIPYQEKLAKQEKELRAKLKVRETSTLQASPIKAGAYTMVHHETYDPNGNVLSEQSYDADGMLKKSVQNTWEGDALVKSIVTNEMGQSYTAVYDYNDKGEKLKETLLRPSGDTLLIRSYEYDEAGNEIMARMDDRQKNRLLSKTMTYDALGRPATIAELVRDSITWEEVYTITDTVWQVLRRNQAGEVMGIFNTNFDPEGKALRIEQLSADKTLRLGIVYSYDANGRLEKENHYGKGGSLLQSLRYTYLDNGLLKDRNLVTNSLPTGLLTKWQYKFEEEK